MEECIQGIISQPIEVRCFAVDEFDLNITPGGLPLFGDQLLPGADILKALEAKEVYCWEPPAGNDEGFWQRVRHVDDFSPNCLLQVVRCESAHTSPEPTITRTEILRMIDQRLMSGKRGPTYSLSELWAMQTKRPKTALESMVFPDRGVTDFQNTVTKPSNLGKTPAAKGTAAMMPVLTDWVSKLPGAKPTTVSCGEQTRQGWVFTINDVELVWVDTHEWSYLNNHKPDLSCFINGHAGNPLYLVTFIKLQTPMIDNNHRGKMAKYTNYALDAHAGRAWVAGMLTTLYALEIHMKEQGNRDVMETYSLDAGAFLQVTPQNAVLGLVSGRFAGRVNAVYGCELR